MKRRILSILVISTMVLSLVACGKKADNTEAKNPDSQVALNTQNGDTEGGEDLTNEQGGAGSEVTNPGNNAGETKGQIIIAEFEKQLNANAEIPNIEIANALLGTPAVEFNGQAMEVEPGYLAGFTTDIDGFSDGVMFGPVIGTIPFVGYVFTVDGDAEAFLEHIKSVSDQNWNICTSADETVGKVIGNRVCFVMCNNQEE